MSAAAKEQTKTADLAIIGAGPSGLFAAYYAGFRGLSTIVVDSLEETGGQVTAMYPEKEILDVGGFPVVRGRELIDRLVTQAEQFSPTYLLGHCAQEFSESADGVVITTDRGVRIEAGAALVTGGIGRFSPRTTPEIDEWNGKGVRYFISRPDELAGHDVVIVGGGDSAFDWVMTLRPLARSVTLVHRRPGFRAHEATVKEILASEVRVLTPYAVSAIRGNGVLDEIELIHLEDKSTITLPAQTVVAALGFIADIGPLESWGLQLEKRRIVVDSTMRTNFSRVFAAGDIISYNGKVPLIAVGFGEAATAVNNLAPLLRTGQKIFPGHSTGSSAT